ncbi:MAG: hypothetical protein ACK5M8_15265 [Shewanella algae]
MSMFRTVSLLLLVFVSASFTLATEGEALTMETVLVTATRYATDPLEIPASVNVLDKQALDSKGFFCSKPETSS